MKKTKLDKTIDAAYYKHFNCVQVPIMDLIKISNEAKEGVARGEDLDEVMVRLREKYGNK